MKKEDVIEEISQDTIEIKKKILATREFYLKTRDIETANFNSEDKITTILLLNFSFYEKFVKVIYEKAFNFINYLNKKNIFYPKEFDYLNFLYAKIGERNKKSKIRHFNIYVEKKFLESFDQDKFLSDNKKLSNIEHLIKFNLLILDKKIETIKKEFYSPPTQKDEKIEEILRELSNLYTIRNDRIHGNYKEEIINNIERVTDLFIFSIDVLSNLLIEILETKF